VVSPLSRALDTARGGFWGLPASGGGADATVRHPPIVALALIAERLDTACDIGRPVSELRSVYTDVDFQFVEEECWWYGGESNWPEPGLPHDSEPWPECQQRVAQATKWLQERPEMSIAVVGHSSFFQAMTKSWAKLENCGLASNSIAQQSTRNMALWKYVCRPCRRPPS